MKKIIGILFLCFLLIGTALADGWTLTQYSDLSGNQAMCYSLWDGEDLILIDGGWTQNTPQVKEIIDSHGGHVKAWFLTHYHGDHADAFNVLWNEYKDQIDMVYCTPLEWDDVKDVFQDWDTPETMEMFLAQTDGADNVKRLYRDDEFEIKGLHIKVYSSFDEEIAQLSDIPNNCSLIFKISSKNKSVLFLGDTYKNSVGMNLLERYGAEDLHADYIQSAHHGNNTQSFDFYKALNPSVIFLDGPEWLMIGENYKAKDTLAWCAEQGITTYDYRQAPTKLPLD